MPRGRDDMQVNVAGLRRNIKNLAHNYSDAQVKVREATSNDPWGPSSTLMAEIADLTYNVMAFTEIMQMIWKRLNDHGKNWRHVYKALVLMEYLIKTGSEKVAMQCKENIFAIQTLKDFQYMEEGKDQGLNVREKAKQLVILLKDDERLKNERARALKAKQRFAQSASAFGSDGALDTPTSPTYPALTSESAEWTGGREAELARPLTAGEEELQLQLALAMSREEAEREERRRRSDDVRLQLAISQSQNDFQIPKRLHQELSSLPPLTEETYPSYTWPYSEHPYFKYMEQNASELSYNNVYPDNTNNWAYNIIEYPQNTKECPVNTNNRPYVISWTCEEMNKTNDWANNYSSDKSHGISDQPHNTKNWSQNIKKCPQNTKNLSQSTIGWLQNTINWPQNTTDCSQDTIDWAQNTKDCSQDTIDWPHSTNNCPQIACEAVNWSKLASPGCWLCGCPQCILHQNVQEPDEAPTRRAEPAQQSHLLDLLDVNLSPTNAAAASSASALVDPWGVPSPPHRPDTGADAWSGVSSPARDPWAPAAAPPPDPWAPALAGLAHNKSPVSVISSPSSSDLEQFDALSRRLPNNNIETDDPFDLTGLGDQLTKPSSPLGTSTGAIKKSPSAFLGENSSLVNLERLLHPAPGADSPAPNPFADPALAPAPAPRQFAPPQPAKLTINELKQQQMGLTGLSFPPGPGTAPAAGMGVMQADPWGAAPRTNSPWSPQNQRHTPNPFLS